MVIEKTVKVLITFFFPFPLIKFKHMIILNYMVMGKESKDQIVCALVDNAIQLENLRYCI